MPERAFLTVAGVKLEFVWHGPTAEQAPTLLFLHEGLGCVEAWRDFPQKLAELTGCGALVYSRQGYGYSDPCSLPRPLSYMQDEALTVLPELIKVAGLREYVLVGHSDGGSIALVYAGGVTSQGLKGVITESAHVFCEDLSVRSIAAAKYAFEGEGLDEKLWKYHRDNTHCAFWGWNDAWLHPEFADWNIEEYLPGIQVPLLAIQGKDDQYGTAAQVEAIASQSGGAAEVCMLDDCAHSPHREQEAETLRIMASYVSEVIGS